MTNMGWKATSVIDKTCNTCLMVSGTLLSYLVAAFLLCLPQASNNFESLRKGENQSRKERTAPRRRWGEAWQERAAALAFAGLTRSLASCFGLGEFERCSDIGWRKERDTFPRGPCIRPLLMR